AGEYEIAVAPGQYDGLLVLCKSGGKWYKRSSGNTLVAGRNLIVNIGQMLLQEEAFVISTPADFSDFLNSAEDVENAYLINDIELDAYSSAQDFAGTFSGLGHTVSGISQGKPVFLQNSGNVSRLSLRGTVNTTALEFAPLALRNYGSIEDVCSFVDVVVSAGNDVSAAIVLGGIAAYNYGTVHRCSNSGAVKFIGSSSVKAAALGGIVGYSESAISDCCNDGNVSLSAKYGSGTAALGNISASAVNIGGVLGAGWNAAELDCCENSGSVSLSLSAIENAAAAYDRCQIGGIVGSPYGDIERSSNSGNVSVNVVTSSRAAFSAYGCTLHIGGISGGSYTQDLVYNKENDHTSISDCVNSGAVNIELDAVSSNSTAGGIVGWPNGEHKSLQTKITSCTNSGNITMNGSGKIRIGGIMGGTGFPDNCENSGTIHVISANSASVIGGIAAFHSQDHGLKSCTNTGDVISDVAINGAAGLIGNHGSVSLSSSTGCKVACKVQNPASDFSGTGMVLGLYNSNSTSVILGSEDSPIDVSGSISCAGREVLIDEESYQYFLCGTAKYSASHIIYAICTVPAPVGLHYAEGYVLYNNSEPAIGVSVSDGFNVTVTDDNGYYKLTTKDDSWYIYVSYPSDAVIEKQSDGRPAFFSRYEYPETRYDFNFTRQPVEKEFSIFAMADPQAHYSKRGNQKTADTNRFLQESVPAINAQAVSEGLPCYGITLGDIVYSEGSRNSVPGMSTMLSHFNLIDMPVFQTMGNHDFTYFYSSSALATDSRSSSLFLKAQRSFENVFGPVNFSFNRGDVHFVCMRNIIFDSNTDASSYHGGFSDDQYKWLCKDLENVSKDKMIVLCVHIPICGILSNEHVKDVLSLMSGYAAATVFSGHTHYKRSYANLNSTGIFEHIHSAVCGQWWWSNIGGDGTPNGYTVYRFNGASIENECFYGVNDQMNTADYQMRLYRGNLKTGGAYAYFQWPFSENLLLINVFNGDSRWKVQVYENGVLSGTASLMANKRRSFSSVTSGQTYTVPSDSNQDWWAIGYHIGVRGRGTTNTSYYTNMFHMFSYTLKDASADVRVVATDPYGNVYTCEDIVSDGSWYPEYVKGVNAF
ncbi:MAG: calcineurin-like phosphoesterase family protein, partial [Bacteroidales bacterium]|nr:calcineurin-like phosphoesterase family protein [Bacteroidales bacterium]